MILSPGRPWLCCVKGLQLSQAPDAEGQNRYFPTHAKACYCYDTYRKLKSFMKNTKRKYIFFFKSDFFFFRMQLLSTSGLLNVKENILNHPLTGEQPSAFLVVLYLLMSAW